MQISRVETPGKFINSQQFSKFVVVHNDNYYAQLLISLHI